METMCWYPLRKVGWWGLNLVKMGVIPSAWYSSVARWEIGTRRKAGKNQGKCAYLGEFRKGGEG
jgi:hypothetical protein